MSKNVIFCFSGTGNCLDIAMNIAKVLGDTDIVMMRKQPVVTDVRECERVGFVVPCYAGGLPEGVEDFVRQIKVGIDAFTFAVGSFSGYMGNGLNSIHNLIPLRLWTGIRHQCSCIWLFPHDLMHSAESSQAEAEIAARDFGTAVLEGRTCSHPPRKNPLNAVENAAWPMLSKLKASKFTVDYTCIGCGQCVKLCPKGNITLTDGRPVFGGDCIQCLGCLQYCPKAAISIGGPSAARERYHNPNVTPEMLNQDIIHID